MFPEIGDSPAHVAPVDHGVSLPLPGKQGLVVGFQKAVVQQGDHALVRGRADHPAGRLHHFVHTRVLVGVGKALAAVLVEIFPQDLLLHVHLRQPGADHNGPDELLFF